MARDLAFRRSVEGSVVGIQTPLGPLGRVDRERRSAYLSVGTETHTGHVNILTLVEMLQAPQSSSRYRQFGGNVPLDVSPWSRRESAWRDRRDRLFGG